MGWTRDAPPQLEGSVATAEGRRGEQEEVREETRDGVSRAGGHGEESGFQRGRWEGKQNSDSGLPVSFWDRQCPQQDQVVYFEIHPPPPTPHPTLSQSVGASF